MSGDTASRWQSQNVNPRLLTLQPLCPAGRQGPGWGPPWGGGGGEGLTRPIPTGARVSGQGMSVPDAHPPADAADPVAPQLQAPAAASTHDPAGESAPRLREGQGVPGLPTPTLFTSNITKGHSSVRNQRDCSGQTDLPSSRTAGERSEVRPLPQQNPPPLHHSLLAPVTWSVGRLPCPSQSWLYSGKLSPCRFPVDRGGQGSPPCWAICLSAAQS